MKPRYSTRIQAKFPVIITVDGHVREGRILDLTVPGCLIESPMVIKKGDYAQLKMLLPGYTSPCSVALAAVRWTKGSRFGVEFIKMHEQAQEQLHYVMARQTLDSAGEVLRYVVEGQAELSHAKGGQYV